MKLITTRNYNTVLDNWTVSERNLEDFLNRLRERIEARGFRLLMGTSVFYTYTSKTNLVTIEIEESEEEVESDLSNLRFNTPSGSHSIARQLNSALDLPFKRL